MYAIRSYYALGLVLFAAVQVAQRSLNYGVLGPAKEMLFTVVDRETKYKSKNFIDTVVYRGSDVTASWIFKGLMSAGLSLSHRNNFVSHTLYEVIRSHRILLAKNCG